MLGHELYKFIKILSNSDRFPMLFKNLNKIVYLYSKLKRFYLKYWLYFLCFNTQSFKSIIHIKI